MDFDVIIVGGGPAGLSAAIHLKQLDPQIRVCLLEKGSEIGAHTLSGCVLDPRALTELLPNWREMNTPVSTAVTADRFYWMTAEKRYRLPTPPQMHNQGNYIISLGRLCRWLGEHAESLGVEIYPGFAGAALLKDAQNAVIGVRTGDMGRDKEGNPTDQFQPGMELLARHTIIAEGCRGHLAEQLMKEYNLRDPQNPQTYGIGFKEIWQVDPGVHEEGLVEHSVGWPLDRQTYGGSFLYHTADEQIAVGFVVGLDYKNPYLSPFEEFQRFKMHPAIRRFFEYGKRLTYGARALNEGGWQAVPNLIFPGGMLVGCSAGFVNVPRVKGTHTAMKSGMLAAEGVINALKTGENDYEKRLKNSWVAAELKAVRNIRPAFQKGMVMGMLYAALDTYIFRGKAPWTFKNHIDHAQLEQDCAPIVYPKPDQKISFDRLSSVFLCNTHHPENQPNHLHLRNPEKAIEHNYALYNSPEQRYCPAGVYEVVTDENDKKRLQINAANCIHCKTCDIKDPLQNIQWTPPEGGCGPNYGIM